MAETSTAVEITWLLAAAHKGDAAAFDWLFLAMAHHRLGQADQAQESLAHASAWSERALRENTPLTLAGVTLDFDQRLELRVLLDEAGELLSVAKP